MKNELISAWNEAEALYIENQKLKAENEMQKSDLKSAMASDEERYTENLKLKEEVINKRKCIHFLLILIILIFLVFGSCEIQKSVSVSNAQSSAQSSTISTTSHKNWVISVPFVGAFFIHISSFALF